MSIVGAFMVPHPPLIVHEVGNGSEEQVRKTLDSYLEIAKVLKNFQIYLFGKQLN